MSHIKKMLGIMIVLFLLNAQGVYAQTDSLCSATKRGGLNVNLQTYTDMYKPSDLLKKYFIAAKISIIWDTKVSGLETRNDNKKGVCKNGSFIGDEVSVRDAFWSRHAYSDTVSHAQAAKVSNTIPLSIDTMTKMQNYITKTCGLSLGIDGKLGKKTVNSTQLCKNLPCKGYCGWDWFSSKIDKLYSDESGTKKIRDGTKFLGDASQKLYIASEDLGVQPYSDGLGPIKKAVDPSDICRTTVLSGVEESVYLAMKPNLVIDKKCCYSGPQPSIPYQLPSVASVGWEISNGFATFTPTGIGPHLPVPPISICADASTSPATGSATEPCRFDPPKGDNELAIYDKTKGDPAYVAPISCEKGCPSNSKEVMKGGAAVCEVCDKKKCNCGIKLNTSVPFIGTCIMNQETNDTKANGDGTITVNSINAFPVLMSAMIKILMSIIMIVCFASLIVGGFMMTIPDQYSTGKGMITKVVRTIGALGMLGTILYIVNPNFFI